MAFVYIGIAVVVFIIIFNISDKAVNKTNPKPQINRVTMDSIENVMNKQQKAMNDLQKLTEDRLYRTLTLGLDKASEEIRENPDYLKRYMEVLIENQTKEISKTVYKTSAPNSLLSDEQIKYSLNEAAKKVLNHANKLNSL
ncbi:hypothetical protein [Seonamhaeicola sp. ML3]|uniref:hypothetical protein n=1 Tax=Seonamhaeicola sp. ML3 TaxID=2937786 RepID=UPI00200D28B2|nr:hypothetical protein [Seonamhaeicola sp. ML3]